MVVYNVINKKKKKTLFKINTLLQINVNQLLCNYFNR